MPSKYLAFFKLSPLSESELEGALKVQLAMFNGQRGRFADLQQDIESTRAYARDKWSALDVWDLYSMELAIVAKALLSLTATEASVERTFSAQDAVHSKKRNRLGDINVESEMFIKFNHRALNPLSDADADDRVWKPPTTELTEAAAELLFGESDTDSDAEDATSSDPDSVSASEADEEAEERKQIDPEMPARSQSRINADNLSFLEQYIRENRIGRKYRWNDDRMNHLEAAAVNNNPGGYSSAQLVDQIRLLVKRSHTQA